MTDKTDIEALRDGAECMANLLDNLAGYEPQDIDMDTVELRFEDEGGHDTGCDISIVDTAQKSADTIRSLLDQLEAERQRADELERKEKGDTRYQELLSLSVEAVRECDQANAELAALRGEQEPVAYLTRHVGCRSPDDCEEYLEVSDKDGVSGNGDAAIPVFTRPPKPVVVLPSLTEERFHRYDEWHDITVFDEGVYVPEVVAVLEAAGIVVKDGE